MGYFSSIYADTELSHMARAVYMYLKDRSDTKGTCWPKIKSIAKDLNISQSTVKRALNELEKAGYITRKRRYRENGSYTSNLYTIQQ